MKSIWLINYNFDNVTAGPTVRFMRYAPLFLAKGYRLTFVTHKSDPGLPDKEQREFYDILRVSNKLPFFKHSLFLFKSFWLAAFAPQKPGSIISIGITTFLLWVVPLLILKKVKIIYVNTMNLHLTYLNGNSVFVNMYNSVHRYLYKVLYSNINYVVSSSSTLSEGFKKLNVPDSKLKIIYNGVNSERFKPVNESEKRKYRQLLNLPLDGKIVLFVGLKVDRKGILDLIDSWKLIYKQHPDYHLILVGDEKTSAGDPDYNAQWDSLKKEMENPELRIINRPNHPQIEEYFFSSDIFIFLSKKEGMPNVVLEAMSAGLPIIMTAFEGFSDDYGNNGEHYWLVERNPEIISQAIVELNSNQDLYNTIQKNSLQRVQDHFLVDASIDKYIQLFESKN